MASFANGNGLKLLYICGTAASAIVGAAIYVGRNVPLKSDLQVMTDKIGMDNKLSKGIFGHRTIFLHPFQSIGS